MTSFTNDPIRVKISLDDIWNCTHPQGIDSTWYPVPESQETEFFVKLSCSDTNPHSPNQEHYKEDLEKEFERLKILQDHCREFGAYKPFNCKKSRVIETILDENVFGKENRYDILLDKAKDVHRLQNGKLFGIIEDS